LGEGGRYYSEMVKANHYAISKIEEREECKDTT
jgi:hypothetical protein